MREEHSRPLDHEWLCPCPSDGLPRCQRAVTVSTSLDCGKKKYREWVKINQIVFRVEKDFFTTTRGMGKHCELNRTAMVRLKNIFSRQQKNLAVIVLFVKPRVAGVKRWINLWKNCRKSPWPSSILKKRKFGGNFAAYIAKQYDLIWLGLVVIGQSHSGHGQGPRPWSKYQPIRSRVSQQRGEWENIAS